MSNCVDCGILIHEKSTRCKSCSAKVTRNRLMDGRTGTRLYTIWRGMKQRCCNPNNNEYKRFYGTNNISICAEWLDFREFKHWAISNGYKDTLSIDRINNKGNYCPNNCQWITLIENARKSRSKAVAKQRNGIILQRYSSIEDASTDTGACHIAEVCNGKRKHSAGFCWSWL